MDMEEYAAAKRLLFVPEAGPAPDWAVLNRRRSFYRLRSLFRPRSLLRNRPRRPHCAPEKCPLRCDGLRFDLVWEGARQPIESALAGGSMCLNILAAAGAGFELWNLARDHCARRRGHAAPCPAALERVDAGQPFLVIVDYAHTPDALRNVIHIARELVSTDGGRVINPVRLRRRIATAPNVR